MQATRIASDFPLPCSEVLFATPLKDMLFKLPGGCLIKIQMFAASQKPPGRQSEG
jgi:hypothetical protein